MSGGPGERTAVTGQETPDCKWLVYVVGWPDHRGGLAEASRRRRTRTSGRLAIPGPGLPGLSGRNLLRQQQADGEGLPASVPEYRSTARVRELATVPRPNWGLTVSPDRRTILFAAMGEGSSNLMMVEGFR